MLTNIAGMKETVLTGKTDLPQKCRLAMDLAARQLRHLVETYPDYFPMYTVNGKWKHDSEAWTNWCEGFLGGQLWLVYEHTLEPWWREKAEHYCRLIEHRKTDRSVHDLGFLYRNQDPRYVVADTVEDFPVFFRALLQDFFKLSDCH